MNRSRCHVERTRCLCGAAASSDELNERKIGGPDVLLDRRARKELVRLCVRQRHEHHRYSAGAPGVGNGVRGKDHPPWTLSVRFPLVSHRNPNRVAVFQLRTRISEPVITAPTCVGVCRDPDTG